MGRQSAKQLDALTCHAGVKLHRMSCEVHLELVGPGFAHLLQWSEQTARGHLAPQAGQEGRDHVVLLSLGSAPRRGSRDAPLDEQRDGVIEHLGRVQPHRTLPGPGAQLVGFVRCLCVAPRRP